MKPNPTGREQWPSHGSIAVSRAPGAPTPDLANLQVMADVLYDVQIRLAAIEKLLERAVPLFEFAERWLNMTPMERVRAGLKR